MGRKIGRDYDIFLISKFTTFSEVILPVFLDLYMVISILFLDNPRVRSDDAELETLEAVFGWTTDGDDFFRVETEVAQDTAETESY